MRTSFLERKLINYLIFNETIETNITKLFSDFMMFIFFLFTPNFCKISIQECSAKDSLENPGSCIISNFLVLVHFLSIFSANAETTKTFSFRIFSQLRENKNHTMLNRVNKIRITRKNFLTFFFFPFYSVNYSFFIYTFQII